jgi:peroxiredoxin Q/BCP
MLEGCGITFRFKLLQAGSIRSNRMTALRITFALAFVTAAAAGAQSTGAPSPTTPAPAAAQPAPPPPPEVDIGKVAPDFTIETADASGPIAKPVKLSDLKGKVVVLAFYPADRSSGCTAELTKFRDEFATLFGDGTVVLPISNDGIESHASWAKDMKFPFALGSDPQLEIAKQYGSWNPARTNASRTVYVIGKDGRILWRSLKFPALTESAYTELAAEVAKAR